jgi:hypothetical protein
MRVLGQLFEERNLAMIGKLLQATTLKRKNNKTLNPRNEYSSKMK